LRLAPGRGDIDGPAAVVGPAFAPADIPVLVAAWAAALVPVTRAGTPRQPQYLLQHSLIGYDRDAAILRGSAGFGLPLTREKFTVPNDGPAVDGRLVAEGAGIGCIADYKLAQFPGERRVLPMLKIPPLPCWPAAHREIRCNPVMRRIDDFQAQALPPALQSVATAPGKTAQAIARPLPRSARNMGRLWLADDASHKLWFVHGRAKRSFWKQTACPWAGTVMFGTRFAF
jgi:hypothetical protein